MAAHSRKRGTERPDVLRAARVQGIHGDARLLRSNGMVRNACVGALCAVWVLYALLLVRFDRGDDWLRFLVLPLVLSGVFVGAVLDVAHRRVERVPTRHARD